MTTNIYKVTLKDSGKRLDKFLADASGVSRSYVQQLIDTPSKKVRYNEEYTRVGSHPHTPSLRA